MCNDLLLLSSLQSHFATVQELVNLPGFSYKNSVSYHAPTMCLRRYLVKGPPLDAQEEHNSPDAELMSIDKGPPYDDADLA